MADRLVTIATFSSPFEAALARNRLEAAGIPACLNGEETIGLFGGFLGPALGEIQLLVSEEHVFRAEDILTETGEERDDEGTETLADENITADPPEPKCDRVGEDSQSDAVTAQRPIVEADDHSQETDEPSATQRALVEEADLDDLKPSRGEKLAEHAFKAAVIGLLIFPVLLHLYSLIQLLRLFTVDEDLSGRAMVHLSVALVIDLLVLFGALLLAIMLSLL